MNKLPIKFKTKWLEALRSGDYRQGRGYLKRGDSFCCLGVAYDMIGGKWIDPDLIVQKTVNGADSFPRKEDYPEEVYEVLNQNAETNGDKVMCNYIHVLASLNDISDNFDEVADYIERNL